MAPTFVGYSFEKLALGELVRAAGGQSYLDSPAMLPGVIAPGNAAALREISRQRAFYWLGNQGPESDRILLVLPGVL